MDIEKLQKITKLAKELQEQGIATDSEEATRMADSMIDKDRELSNIQDTISGVSSESETSSEELPSQETINPEITPQETVAPQPAQDSELRLKVSNLVMQIEDQTKEISSLKDQLAQLKSQIDSLEEKRAAPIMEKAPDQPQTSLHTEEVKKEDPHPKSGGFDSGDVSVENVFYSGPPK